MLVTFVQLDIRSGNKRSRMVEYVAPMDLNAVTVMGPDSNSDTLNGVSVITPPKFISGKTSKLQYRDALRRWFIMLNRIAQSDQKTKGLLNGAGRLIYLACDNDAQCILQQAEVSESLNLNGSDTEPSRWILINTIIELIAKDNANERIQHELNCL